MADAPPTTSTPTERPLAMIPLVGLSLGGRVASEHLAAVGSSGVVGRPVWGPDGLLRDLELRLGLSTPAVDATVRVQQWARALHAHVAASPDVFFARSLATDPLGTARALLAWRDELVLAGWDGARVADGGPRLDALAAVEAVATVSLGTADRVRRVERALEVEGGSVYDGLELSEPREAWPGRWQRVFERVASCGARVEHRPALALFGEGGAPASTDLGRVQAALRGENGDALVGDGSFVVLQAETSWELADSAAALLGASFPANPLVIRGGDARALDLALATHGLPTQGSSQSSPWRGGLELLSLGVQLLFAPRDVFRVLDLVTLPGGPFDNLMGGQLAKALCEAPGIGGREWVRRKEKISEYTRLAVLERKRGEGATEEEAARVAEAAVARQLGIIAEWIERPLHDPVQGAPKAALLEVVHRTCEFLRARHALVQANRDTDNVAVLGVAIAQAEAMSAAVVQDPRGSFGREEALQQVWDAVRNGAAVAVTSERASRLEVAESPGGARRRQGLVLWWHCVAGTEWRPGPRAWRSDEVRALAASGVSLPDRAARLAAEAGSWRAAVMAATERLVLCVPRNTVEGSAEPHPVLTEIHAAMRADAAAKRRVLATTVELRGLEERSPAAVALLAAGSRLAPLELASSPLPPAKRVWRSEPALLVSNEPLSAGQIEALVGCPLRWVLDKRAKLTCAALASIPRGALLLGKLAHRIVETLHERKALGERAATERELEAVLPRLVEEEAAPLLSPGKAFERAENDREMRRSLSALSELLESSSLRVLGVETELDAVWLDRKLTGRIDILLVDEAGREAVLDLKWGTSAYRTHLEKGTSIQLAVYAAARSLLAAGDGQLRTDGFPHAAYFSLKKGRLLATERGPYFEAWPLSGPTIRETWERLVSTVELAHALLGRGEIVATGVQCAGSKSSPRFPLLDAAEVPLVDRGRRLLLEEEHGCGYCKFGAICGKRFEELC